MTRCHPAIAMETMLIASLRGTYEMRLCVGFACVYILMPNSFDALLRLLKTKEEKLLDCCFSLLFFLSILDQMSLNKAWLMKPNVMF